MATDFIIVSGEDRQVQSIRSKLPAWKWTFVIKGAFPLAVGECNSNGSSIICGPTPQSEGLRVEFTSQGVEVIRGPFAWIPVWWTTGRLNIISTNPGLLDSVFPQTSCHHRALRWQAFPRDYKGNADFVRGVFRQPPSSILSIGANGLTLRPKIVSPRPPFHPDEFEDAAAALLDALMASLERLPANTSIALSGGLDSSAILAGLVALGRRPRTFTMKTRHPLSDEVRWVDELTEYFGLARATQVNIDDFSPFVARIPFVEGPQFQPTEPFETAFYQRAAFESPVATGLGADQLFDASLHHRLRSAWSGNDYGTWRADTQGLSPMTVAATTIRKSAFDPASHVFESWAWEGGMRGLRRIHRSLRNSIFAPFLTPELLALTRAMPPHWFQQGHSNKHILRHALQGLLPLDVRSRPKSTHFGPVVTHALRQRSTGDVAKDLESLDPCLSFVIPSEWRKIALTRWESI